MAREPAKKRSPKAKRIGRPPKAGVGKRSAFNTRLRSDVKERLEEEAASLSEEIETRLEKSLSREDEFYDRFGGVGHYRMMLLLAATLQVVEQVTEKQWHKDRSTYEAAREAINAFFEQFRPSDTRMGLLHNLPPAGLGESAAKEVLGRFVPSVAVADEQKRPRKARSSG